MVGYAFSKLQSVTGDAGTESSVDTNTGDTIGVDGNGSNISVSSFDGNEAIIKVETDINNSLGAAKGQLQADRVSAIRAKEEFLKLLGTNQGNMGTEVIDGVTQGGKRIITYKITRR
jgi:hypothetical protein